MTSMDPRDFFGSGTPVWTLAVRGVVRLATSASAPADRYRDALLLPATTLGARTRRQLLAVGAWAGAGRGPGSASSDALARVERIAACVEGCSRWVAIAGTPGPEAKTTLALLDASGRPVGFAKIATSDEARALVANESQLLRAVGGTVGPRLLGEGSDDSAAWIVVEPLCGRASAPGARFPRVLLQRTRPGAGVTFAEHPAVVGLPATADEVVRRARSGAGDRRFLIAPVHGDAAPWNAVVGPDGATRLFDWEYGRLDGLPETDAAHWSIQSDRLLAKMRPDEAVPRAVRALASEGGLSRGEAAAVCVVTCVVVASRQSTLGASETAAWWSEAAEVAGTIAVGSEEA